MLNKVFKLTSVILTHWPAKMDFLYIQYYLPSKVLVYTYSRPHKRDTEMYVTLVLSKNSPCSVVYHISTIFYFAHLI